MDGRGRPGRLGAHPGPGRAGRLGPVRRHHAGCVASHRPGRRGNWYAFIHVSGPVQAWLSVPLGIALSWPGCGPGRCCCPSTAGSPAGCWPRASRAALGFRVEQLTRTRAVAVDAQAAEVRRIERDLHDGAQARLVALGMSLGAGRGAGRPRPGGGPRAARRGPRVVGHGAGRTARPGPRHPPAGARRPRSGRRGPRRWRWPARCRSTVERGPAGPAAGAGGVGRLLRGRRGAGQRRPSTPAPHGPCDRPAARRRTAAREVARRRRRRRRPAARHRAARASSAGWPPSTAR